MYQNSSIFFILYIISLIMIHQTTSTYGQRAHYCSNTTMFVNNSAFQTNLNTLFRSMSTNATNNPSGYYQTTVGGPTGEAIYGHYLCRGDLNVSSCHGCVTTATTDLPETYCPNRKVSLIWYDECMVRYSNQSFFGSMGIGTVKIIWNSKPIIGDTTTFMDALKNVSANVTVRAAEGGPSNKKFATDFVNYTFFEPIYVLGQCTPDLSPNDCYLCLNLTAQLFHERAGGQVFAPSCFIQHETYPFFNLSYLPQSSQPPKQSPLPSSPSDLRPVVTPSGNKKVSTKLIVSVVAAVVIVFLMAFLFACICLLKRKSRKIDESTATNISDPEFTVESLQYDLATLISATNNFSDENKLGEGGFGGVYKGTLSNERLIAVKRLSVSSSQGMQEFKTEALLVAKLQHRNLVQLIGFCYTKQEKLLVYEYVANKSLDYFLFNHEKRRQLSWQKRYNNIIRGIARGLLYLHHDSQLRIIHRDLKASNVLLDEEMNPKISDFGTARIFDVDHRQTIYTSRVVGTRGYMAPEYVLEGQFSVKLDVYSFGVLVLEIISGERNCTFNRLDGVVKDLLSEAWLQWEAGTPLKFVDPLIRDSCSNNSDEVMRCIQLGLLCVQESVENRPTMANVALSLESCSITLPIPKQPDLLARTRVVSTISKVVGSDDSSSKSVPLFVNEISVTKPEAR
ncbi:hypothetical protein vseg_017406 [Gypsophila vaccaria]